MSKTSRQSHELRQVLPLRSRACRKPQELRIVRNPENRGVRWRSDRLLEVLGGAEGDLLAGLDIDCFAGRRIASQTGSTLTYQQDSEAGYLHPLTLLQVL